MKSKRKQQDPFAELTWSDLDAWAGSRIVARGKHYQKQGLVSDLAKTEDGALLAWVSGTDTYATLVEISKNGDISSECTCPYDGECKHAVAVVIEYLQFLKEEKPITIVDDEDERILLLLGLDEDNDEEWDFEEEEADDLPPAVRGEKQTGASRQTDLESFLNGKTKTELVKIILEAADRNPR